jgi:NADP-dependent 3-hydroxy acid dehydrogenase YdfG
MKLALVTGASSGIGAATARAFASKGLRVVLVARSDDALRKLAGEIGNNAVANPCDAGDGNDVLAMAKHVIDAHGVPDVVVNCAGSGRWERVEDTPPDEARQMMSAPYHAAFNVTHAFMAPMLAHGSGVFIHINSPACIMAWPSSAGYTAARAALRGFHEALVQDLAGTRLRSCHVIFGKVSSGYFENNSGVEDKIPTLARTIPTLTTTACADTIVRVAFKPRTQVIRPLILRVYCTVAMIFPPLVRWMLRF